MNILNVPGLDDHESRESNLNHLHERVEKFPGLGKWHVDAK